MLTIARASRHALEQALAQVAQAEVVDARHRSAGAVPGTPAMLASASMRSGSCLTAASIVDLLGQVGLDEAVERDHRVVAVDADHARALQAQQARRLGADAGAASR